MKVQLGTEVAKNHGFIMATMYIRKSDSISV